MRRSRFRLPLGCSCLTLLVTAAPARAGAQAPREEQITAAVFNRPEFTRQFAGRRVEKVRFSVEGPTGAGAASKTVASIVIFDHTQGRAFRVRADGATGEVLQVEELHARPAASAKEIQDAAQLVRADPELAAALKSGAVVQDGIIVQAPDSFPADRKRHRIMQVRVLSPDRNSVLFSAFVDLTDRSIPLRQKPQR